MGWTLPVHHPRISACAACAMASQRKSIFTSARKPEQARDNVPPSLASLNDYVDVLFIGRLRTNKDEPYRVFQLRDNGNLSTLDGKLGLRMGGAEVVMNAEEYTYRICERPLPNTPSLYTIVQAPDRAAFMAWRAAFEVVLRGTCVADQYRAEPDRPLAAGAHALLLNGLGARAGAAGIVVKVVPRRLPDPGCAFSLATVSRRLRAGAVVSPYLVDVLDVFNTPQETHVVMPNVGPPLRSQFAHGPVDEPRARDMFGQLCAAVRALHGAGISHGAIAPGNVLVQNLNPRLHVRLAGFCLATVPDPRVKNRRAPRRTLNQLVHGLAAEGLQYIAPELVADPTAVSPSSDFWALGVILYQALTGELPFSRPLEEPAYDPQDQMQVLEFLRRYKSSAVTEQVLFPAESRAEELSADAKSLILLLLNSDPERRSDDKAIRQHPWGTQRI